MNRAYRFLLLACAFLLPAGTGLAQDVQRRAPQNKAPVIVASIKPLQSLVQGVTGGTGETLVLVEGDVSPHGFSFKPSQLKALHEADVVFYFSADFELFLPGALAGLPPQVRQVPVVEKARLTVLEKRKGGAWEAHDHHDHGHGDHHDQRHEDHHDHGHEDHHDRRHEDHHDRRHEDHHDHGHEDPHDRRHEDHHDQRHEDHHDQRHEDHHDRRGGDMHVWLDAGNAKEIAKLIAAELGAVYPENRDGYERNARALIARIDALDAKIKSTLADVKDKPFIVFHDAYQYFERRYGLSGVGSITLEPHEPLSANRILEIRAKIKTAGVVCVFREPQFSDKLIRTATQETDVRIGTLDPLGAGLESGADLYFDLLGNLGREFKHCLS